MNKAKNLDIQESKINHSILSICNVRFSICRGGHTVPETKQNG
jgi:hypothetical protein